MTLIDKDQMEKHIMESKVFTRYFKELVQSLIWGEKTIEAVEVVHGEWIDISEYVTTAYGHLDIFKCSNCSAEITIDDHDDYCPNCGAKMDGHKKDVM